MEKEEDYEILKTNLQPFFWRKVKNIIRQNKKDALLEFLFGKDEDNKLLGEGSNPQGEEMRKTLQNQVDSLQLFHRNILEGLLRGKNKSNKGL